MPSLAPRPMPDDLSALVCALVDGTIDGPGLARLEERLRGDREARDAFRDFMQMESILTWELVRLPPLGGEVEGPGGACDRPTPRWGGAWRRAAAWLLPLVAAAVTAGVVAVIPMVRHKDDRPGVGGRQQHARLVDATDARWAGGVRLEVGDEIADGPLRLEAGSAQLRFESGAVVTLNGPSEIETLGPNRLFLRNGNIVPFVPPTAKGFTVVSPTGEVIDLGTEFSVSVDARGQTDIYVIDGEVDVAAGHSAPADRLRMTQGFGTRLASSDSAPMLTQSPLVIDNFDGEKSLQWHDADGGRPSSIVGGKLSIPLECRLEDGVVKCYTRLALDHDFSKLCGRRSVISFTVNLPAEELSNPNRWLACVIDAGEGNPPLAYEDRAALGVLVSPHFQVGVRINGTPILDTRVFARSEDAVGPYQVFIAIDDTPVAWKQHGGAIVGVTVNGQQLVGPFVISLADNPRIGLQAFCEESKRGRALVDDFSVSVSTDSDELSQRPATALGQ
jgi:ferric-dicitrate binding protein FerR (iron transport regulator)